MTEENGFREKDFKFVEIGGEQFVEWEPEWNPEEERRIEAGVDDLRRRNSFMRSLRESLSMTQEEFAELLGVTQSNVSKLEAKFEPRLSALAKLVEHRKGRLLLVVELDGCETTFQVTPSGEIVPTPDQLTSSSSSSKPQRRQVP